MVLAERVAGVLAIAAWVAVAVSLYIDGARPFDPDAYGDYRIGSEADWVTTGWHWSEGVRWGVKAVVDGDTCVVKPIVNGPQRGKWRVVRRCSR